MLTFPREEYLARIEKTKQRMQKEGIDCLLISQQANMNYLTGYDGWSFYVHQCVIVSLEQEQPIWIGRGMDANGARILSFLDKENIYEYPDYLVHNTVDHPMHHIAKLSMKKAGTKKHSVSKWTNSISPTEHILSSKPNSPMPSLWMGMP